MNRRQYILRILLAAAVLATCRGGLRADSVRSQDRTWDGVKILQIQDGRLRFTDRNGAQQAVLLTLVTRLQVDLREDLTRAEDLRLQGQLAEAVKAYESALRTENRNDLAGLIRWRLMTIHGRDGQLDRAVEMYVDLARQPDFLMVVKDWRPEEVAGVRPKTRDLAVAMLEEALRQTRMGLAGEYMRQVRDYILAGGPAPASQSSASQPATSTPAPATVSTTTTAETSPADDIELSNALARGALKVELLEKGEYRLALALANRALAAESVVRERLEDALFIRGVALWHLAKDRDMQLQAGWALARVLVEFPSSRHVPQCQYYLGLVHAGLGRVEKARELLLQAQQHPAASDEFVGKVKQAYQDIVVKQ